VATSPHSRCATRWHHGHDGDGPADSPRGPAGAGGAAGHAVADPILRPNINSYKRYRPQLAPPPGGAVGRGQPDPVPALVGHGSPSLRVEPVPGADVNQYLAIAGQGGRGPAKSRASWSGAGRGRQRYDDARRPGSVDVPGRAGTMAVGGWPGRPSARGGGAHAERRQHRLAASMPRGRTGDVPGVRAAVTVQAHPTGPRLLNPATEEVVTVWWPQWPTTDAL